MKKTKIGALTIAAGASAVAVFDFFQTKHSIRRNFPLVGRGRWAAEALRPPVQQYFIESDTDGAPFDRETRTMIYQQAKNLGAEEAFGTERDLLKPGRDHIMHSANPAPVLIQAPKVRLGGPDCTKPYDISLFNVSSMSFGSLSKNAVLAMNKGAAMGGFAHETGEGGLTKYHLRYGADLVWEIGSGYFGCRNADGTFSPEKFTEKATLPQVKAILIKLSQGAKPGMGGMLPGEKVSAEIAEARGIPEGVDCLSPASHSAFSNPTEMMEFVKKLRELSGGKPVGIKFCVGTRHEVLCMMKAMLETGITPDFITVDGAEGGTGAAPLEFLDRVGSPLSEGLMIVHNALVGCNLRHRVAIGAAGKIVGGADIIRRLAIGADFTNSARGMMMAVGCIQAKTCHSNTCPAGVATQDARLMRGLDVDDKAERVKNYQANTLKSAMRILSAMGLTDFSQLGPAHVVRRIDPTQARPYEDIFDWLNPGALVDGEAPYDWQRDFDRADASSYTSPPSRIGLIRNQGMR
ncbi:FMN-binding glutamate synthase family protein [Corynebacterium epidermidicanis]|uniref:Glutamate synthase family protein n=1 Tax=Corynebacterium epidermidicanis TaxID=1050174 RepID=A0A0G3GRB4_9CORY|nr:FMN-binding glutamate synthase family protein [Corynebacterium epidermidicanis]AKK03644.1 glutamate synthase family protein [Corynebacterium epidermidicanis]